MEGLDVTKLPIDLLLNILNIILLFLITRFLVYKPVKKFLDERKARINAENEKAQQVTKEAEDIKAEYEKKLADAESQARKVILEGEEKAGKEAVSIIENANKEAEQIKADARLQAQREKQAALDSLQGDVASLAVSISEKILDREVSDKDNEKIVERFLKNGDNA